MQFTVLFLAALAAPAALAVPALLEPRAVTLCDQYAYYSTNGYEFSNNLWGRGSASSGSQCTYVDGYNGNGVQWRSDWQWAGGDNDVKSYVYSGRQITRKLVSQLSNLQTTAQWSYSNTNIRCNVAYDLFTAADINHDKSSGDYELMVWLARYGNVQPIGSNQGNVNIGGRNWEFWYGLNGNMKVFSFVSSSPINSYSGNLKDFFTYMANNRGFPANSQNLITYQFGTEAFTGSGSTLTVSQWSANAS